jgi:hypothetical protein
MARRAQRMIGGVLLVVAGSFLSPQGAAAEPDLAKKLSGEWSIPQKRQSANDTLTVWTFRNDGTVRLDAIDAQSRQKVREGPMVGRWRVDGDEVVCIWEVWNDTYRRPARDTEASDRFRVRAISEKELSLQVVARRGRPVSDEELLRYQRFSGWGQKP